MGRRPKPSQDELPELEPFTFALEYVRAFEANLNGELKEIAELEWTNVVKAILPGIKTVFTPNGGIYFELTDDTASFLAIRAHGDTEAMRIVRDICTSNVCAGQPVPQPMRGIAWALLQGRPVGAKRRGAQGGKGFGGFFVAYFIANILRDAYGIPLVTSEGANVQSAAEVVWDAFDAQEFEISLAQICGWLTHPKHKDNRVRADSLIALLWSDAAEQLGLAKRRPFAGMHPDALFSKFGRVTN